MTLFSSTFLKKKFKFSNNFNFCLLRNFFSTVGKKKYEFGERSAFFIQSKALEEAEIKKLKWSLVCLVLTSVIPSFLILTDYYFFFSAGVSLFFEVDNSAVFSEKEILITFLALFYLITFFLIYSWKAKISLDAALEFRKRCIVSTLSFEMKELDEAIQLLKIKSKLTNDDLFFINGCFNKYSKVLSQSLKLKSQNKSLFFKINFLLPVLLVNIFAADWNFGMLALFLNINNWLTLLHSYALIYFFLILTVEISLSFYCFLKKLLIRKKFYQFVMYKKFCLSEIQALVLKSI